MDFNASWMLIYFKILYHFTFSPILYHKGKVLDTVLTSALALISLAF